MEASTLAQQFNDVSDSLHTRGHRVIVRRVRSFLEAGDTLGAETFLTRAKESLGNSDAGVGALAQSLKGFAAEGGDVSRLVTDPAWVEGTARESRLGRMVDASVGGQDLGGLADQLARQQSALAAGEPLAKVPARQMAPSALPPLPKSAPAGEDSRSPVGNIFANQRRPRAVIEALADLEPKPLDLDDQGDAGHDDETPELRPAAPEVPDVEALAAPVKPMLANFEPSPAPIAVAAPEAELLVAVKAPAESPRGLPPMIAPAPPELSRPPEMTVVAANAKGSGGKGGLVVGIVVALAAIAAGLFFALK